MAGQISVLDLLESATTVRGRIALTAAVIVVTALLARLAVPYAVQQTELFVRERILAGRAGEALGRIEAELPFDVSATYLIVAYQALLVLAGAMAIVVVWGLIDPLRDVLVALVGLVRTYWSELVQVSITVALLLAAYVVIGLLDDFLQGVRERSDRLDRHQSEVVFRVLQVVVLTTAGIAILGYWEVDLGGLLIGAGFLGIVVGMAARQTLGAMIAGFVLMFSKPFQVGDWVEIGDHEGVVTDITIVNTRMENFDGEYVVVPNDVVGNSTVVNRTRKGRLRLRLQVGVDYSVAPERAEAIATEAIRDLEEVMSVPRPQVLPTEFGDSAIRLELRFWIDNPSSRRRWRAKAAVVRTVYDAFETEGVKIPFPQRELSGRAETGGFRVAPEPAGSGELELEPAGGPASAGEAGSDRPRGSSPEAGRSDVERDPSDDQRNGSDAEGDGETPEPRRE